MGFMYSKGFKMHHKKIIEIFEIWKMKNIQKMKYKERFKMQHK